MRSTFKVLFYVKKGSEKPNGTLPLMCRIMVDGEIKQFSCKMDVPPCLWDVKNNRASGKSVEAQRINLAVDKIRVEVNRRYQELMQTDGYVTADKLKDTYLGIGIKQEISFLKAVIARVAAWFPSFREMLRIENLCRLVGFDERQTTTLVKGKPLEYAGELYSEEHGRKFTTEKAGFQVLKGLTDGTKLVLDIDRKPIVEWFKEQFEKLRQNIRRPIQPQREGRGI